MLWRQRQVVFAVTANSPQNIHYWHFGWVAVQQPASWKVIGIRKHAAMFELPE
jgi:hypothetical protein